MELADASVILCKRRAWLPEVKIIRKSAEPQILKNLEFFVFEAKSDAVMLCSDTIKQWLQVDIEAALEASKDIVIHLDERHDWSEAKLI